MVLQQIEITEKIVKRHVDIIVKMKKMITVTEYVTHIFLHGDAGRTVPDQTERPVIPKSTSVSKAEEISDKSTVRGSEVRVSGRVDSSSRYTETLQKLMKIGRKHTQE